MKLSTRVRGHQSPPRGWPRRTLTGLTVTAVAAAMLGSIPAATAAPVGNGFVVNAADLAFILKQIEISERHAATQSPDHMCDTLIGPAVDQIPNALTSY